MTTDQYDFIIIGGGACVDVGCVTIPYAKELEQAPPCLNPSRSRTRQRC